MKYETGKQVVSLQDWKNTPRMKDIIEGEVLTIRAIYKNKEEELGLSFIERLNPIVSTNEGQSERYYCSTVFIPLQENFKAIEFTKILELELTSVN